ncbi:uncharacterized protein [Venturia canescens]|uniref:uncharacterized protein isoform X2 n=1 Tax=Venturia canescens TaxID=32260 RepID=UPI001C9D0ADD|nr:uncharacterized protein LOC122416451 isoform X2 [Venturia canescens]
MTGSREVRKVAGLPQKSVPKKPKGRQTAKSKDTGRVEEDEEDERGRKSNEGTELEESPAQVSERFGRGCECQDESCFRGLSPDAVYRHRLNIAELTKAEHDMYLMGVTMACLTDPGKTARRTERRRSRARYVSQGRRVCLDAFLYLENCTRYQIKRIRKHLQIHGVCPRVHGNQGKVPHNTFSLDIYQIATDFLKKFIAAQELKQRTKTAKNSPLHLPPEITRKNVHEMYAEFCEKTSSKVMGYSTFRRFMKVQFPQVKFAKLEFVLRGQHSGKVDSEKPQYSNTQNRNSTFVTQNLNDFPIVVAARHDTFLLTPVKKISEDLGLTLTEDGLLVNGTGQPVTLSTLRSV